MSGKRVVLTERVIRSLKPAPKGKRYSRWDAIVPGLDVQVTDTGHKSFGLTKRYPKNPKNPTRRKLGDVGAITLDQARPKARGWLELIGKGIDPAVDEARQRAEAQRGRSTPLPPSAPNSWSAMPAGWPSMPTRNASSSGVREALGAAPDHRHPA